MKSTVLAIMLAVAAGSSAQANDAFGTWQTEKSDGKYLHVKVHACESDAAKTCGTITGAFGGAAETNVGKPIIWDMTPDGATSWGDGKIWKADEDEVYDSEMELKGGKLIVSGCILFGQVCKSQTWPKVE